MSEINTMGTFYVPQDISRSYVELAEVYKKAFAGEPWREVSKCASSNQQECPGGLSATKIGELCLSCFRCPSEPAYTVNELVDKFSAIGNSKDAAWYIEETNGEISMASLAWLADSSVVATEKYADTPAMGVWIPEAIGTKPFIWLDEVFADKDRKPTNNLSNFAAMLDGFRNMLGEDTIAYRTITPQMISASRRIGARVLDPAAKEVPDRRTFVIANILGGK